MTAMFSKVWIINIVLAALILFSWARIWEGRDTPINIPAQTVALEKTGSIKKFPAAGAALARPASSLEYDGIVEMNLFSPDRMFVVEAVEPEPVVEAEARISGEKIVLYGVVLLDADKKALINNPVRKPGERDFLWVREGERLSNLRVIKIDPDQLLLNDGAVQYEIDLYDPGKARSQASPSTRASVSQQRSDAPQVISADPAPSPATPTGTGARTSVPAQPRPSRPAAAPKQEVTGDDDDEYEIVDTPFGAFRRKKTK
jgi:hypothetical protein